MGQFDNSDGDEKGLLGRIGRGVTHSSHGKNPLAGRDLSKVRDPDGNRIVYQGTKWETVLPAKAPDIPKPKKRKLDAFGTKQGKDRKWVRLGKPMLKKVGYTDSLAENGLYPRERRALHKRIRRHVMPEPTVKPKKPGERIAYLLGGGPAAGKSSLGDKGVVSFPGKDKAFFIGADEAKVLIPEYQDWTDDGIDAAEFVHAESKHIGDYMTDHAVASGHDFILDTTGDGSYSKHRRRVEKLKRNGHKVVAHYVTSSLPTALRRAEERRLRTGRGVPESQIIHTHQQVSRVVPKSLRDGLFDEFYLWDNDVDGADPILIAHLDDTGHLVVLDQEKWMAFIKKGARPKKRQPKGRRKPASGYNATRFPGFGGTGLEAQSDDWREMLEDYRSYLDKKADSSFATLEYKAAKSTASNAALEEALQLIGNDEAPFDTEDIIQIQRDVIRSKKPKTRLEKFLLDEYNARDKKSQYDNPYDLPDPLPKSVARMYAADEREDGQVGEEKSLYSAMVTGTPSRFGRVERDGDRRAQVRRRKRRRELVEERRQLAKPNGSLNAILTKAYRVTNDVIDVKAFAIAALVDATDIMQEMKSGLIGSHDRTVQAVESVVSYGIPGDMSRVRSPIRSTLYRAATPGGGGGGGGNRIGRTIGRGAQAMRCPTGYQYGGRFSNRFLSNCGQQLFDVPGVELNEPNAPAPVRVTRTIIGALGTQRAGLGRIGAGEYSTIDATISRMANVAPVGAANRRRADEQIAAGIAAAAAAKTDFVRLVRRDGVSLQSKVPLAKLASQRKNPDMTDGTVISRVARYGAFGRDEVPLLSAGVASVRLITPGGGELRLDRKRPLTAGESSKVRREWSRLLRASSEDDGALSLQRLAASIEALSYSERFDNVDNPNELVRIERNGVERVVPRWAYMAFFADTAPGRNEKDQAWTLKSVVAQADTQAVSNNVGNLRQATEALDNNATLDDVPSKFLQDLTNNRKLFTATSIGNNRSLLVRKNGDRVISMETDSKAALSNKVASDLERTLGVTAPKAWVSGSGARRTFLVEPADRSAPDLKLVANRGLTNVRRDELARIALVDYLFGRDGRTPGGIAVGTSKGKTRAIPTTMGTVSTTAALVRRPEEVLTSDGHWTQGYFAQPQRQVRQAIVQMYDNLLDTATKFDWEAYLTRLGLSGELSDADKVHLATVRRLFATRLEQLRSSRKTVLRIFGVGSL